MPLLSAKIKKAIRESAQTSVLATVIFAGAFGLTFLEDLAKKTTRPPWLIIGIEILSVVLFIADAMVILSIVARVVLMAIREFADEIHRK
jgi:hypothetical protein